MSRAYRVQVREQLKKVIHAEDHVSTELEMLNLLPAAQMASLLADELEKEGFQRDDSSMHKSDGDINVQIDLETGKVTVRATRSESVTLEGKSSGQYYDDLGPSKKQTEKELRKNLQEQLQGESSQKSSELQHEVTSHLERHLGDVRNEVDRAVNRATAEALKQKAASLGQIREMTEDPEAGSLTIVIEV